MRRLVSALSRKRTRIGMSEENIVFQRCSDAPGEVAKRFFLPHPLTEANTRRQEGNCRAGERSAPSNSLTSLTLVRERLRRR